MKGFGIGLTALVVGLIGTLGLGATLERRSVEEMTDAATAFWRRSQIRRGHRGRLPSTLMSAGGITSSRPRRSSATAPC